MKMWKSKSWQHEVTGFDGNAILFGVNIFDYEWKDTRRSEPFPIKRTVKRVKKRNETQDISVVFGQAT